MKWILLGVTLFMYNYAMWCQDIMFPNNEELGHVSGNSNATVTDRIPVFIPGRCPPNMLLYPGYGNVSVWVCDCRPRFLYFPSNDSCHEAYKRGPCPPNHYVVLPRGEAIPKCERNPCKHDGMVKYRDICHPLRSIGGPCGNEGVLGVNETSFQLECIPTEVAPFIIIDLPQKPCPAGSRRNALGMCRRPL